MQRGRVGRETLRVGDQDVGAGEELIVQLLGDDGAVAEVEEPEQRAVVGIGTGPVALVGPSAQGIALG